jgi:hypothetical protein
VKSPSPSLALAAALLLNLQACGGGGGGSAPAPAPSPAPAPAPAPAPSPTPSNTWTLVWEDTFDGPAGTAPNPLNWTDALGNAEASGWGNHELQSYTAAPEEHRTQPTTARARTNPQGLSSDGHGISSTRQVISLGISFEQSARCPQPEQTARSCCSTVPSFQRNSPQGSSQAKRLIEKKKMVFSTESTGSYYLRPI